MRYITGKFMPSWPIPDEGESETLEGARLVLRLSQKATDATGTEVLDDPIEFPLDSNGCLPKEAQVIGNDELKEPYTYYSVVAELPGNVNGFHEYFSEALRIAGGRTHRLERPRFTIGKGT